jgi:hypothetical protein
VIHSFHHVDSRSGERIDQLRAEIARVAATLPDLRRRYPRSWREFRDALKQRDDPYLLYAEYERLAGEAGLDAGSVALLARIANQLGQWITVPGPEADEPGDDLTGLVIRKPDWLSTAISLVVNDEETYAAKGLLPHSRLHQIWDNPAHRHRYPPRLFRSFLALMERFELSYRVTDPARRAEQTSLIPLRLAPGRPDLTAWSGYRPEWPRAGQICEITEADGRPARLPEGLMCQLIVRFHPYSLGQADVRDSVHWLHGMVLEDSYQGRALIEARDNLIWVTVCGVSPGFLLYRLTDEIRQLVQQWEGFRVSVKVPCGTCPPTARNRGLFPIEILMRVREEAPAIHCLTCGRAQRIDALLALVSPAQLAKADAGPLTVGEVQQVVRAELEPLADRIAENGVRNERGLHSLGAGLIGHLVARDEKLDDFLESLDDEVRRAPWLAGIDELPATVRRPRLTHVGLRLSLWCEHARLPLSVLRNDPKAGVYELTVPREWLVKAAPYLRVGLTLLRTFTPIVGDGLDGVLSDAARQTLGDQLKAAGDSLEPLLEEAGSYRVLEAGPADRAASAIVVDRAERPSAAVLRRLQQLIEEQDPTFAGLERVRYRTGGHTRYRWVDPRFVGLYRAELPDVPGPGAGR